MPGVTFYSNALSRVFEIGLGAAENAGLYTGVNDAGLFTKWLELSESTSGVEKMLRLVWTDLGCELRGGSPKLAFVVRIIILWHCQTRQCPRHRQCPRQPLLPNSQIQRTVRRPSDTRCTRVPDLGWNDAASPLHAPHRHREYTWRRRQPAVSLGTLCILARTRCTVRQRTGLSKLGKTRQGFPVARRKPWPQGRRHIGELDIIRSHLRRMGGGENGI